MHILPCALVKYCNGYDNNDDIGNGIIEGNIVVLVVRSTSAFIIVTRTSAYYLFKLIDV